MEYNCKDQFTLTYTETETVADTDTNCVHIDPMHGVRVGVSQSLCCNGSETMTATLPHCKAFKAPSTPSESEKDQRMSGRDQRKNFKHQRKY